VYNHLNDIQFQSCNYNTGMYALLFCDANVLGI
jgi:hypothetical protein